MRHLFLINPAAGKRKSTAQLEGMLSSLSFPYEVAYTSGEGDARRMAEEAVSSGEPVRIYACGGDGTLNEVVNGAAGHEHAAITCIPKGTGNDFLKIFGPDYRALFYDLERLAKGPQTAMDLMDCNGMLGIDVVCAGVDARVAASVHRYKNWPLVTGKGAYVLALAEHVLLRGISRPMSIALGERTWRGEAAILCICNGRHYGGGFMPVPEAMPDDGVLEVLLVPKVSRRTFIKLAGQYARGRYRDYPELILSHRGDRVTYASPQVITTVVDGEVLFNTTFTVRLSEKKVNFFYPPGASYCPESLALREENCEQEVNL